MITVTQKAAEKLKEKMEKDKENWIRVFIRGAG